MRRGKTKKTRSQGFQIKRIHRREIKLAKYNPRKIAPENRSRLKKGLEQFGQVQPPVWNASTGNLVGGHQRLAILDESGLDYEIEVAAVQLTPRQEQKLNLLLNNPKAQAAWDDDKLKSLLDEIGQDLDGTGFKAADFSEQIDQLAADMIPESWQILIDCAGEDQQTKLLAQFAKEGISCRALIS